MSQAPLSDALEYLLELAGKEGADAADAVGVEDRSLSVSVRGGRVEEVESTEGRDVGVRVMFGQRQACVSTSDLSKDNLNEVVARAVAMARLAPEDKWSGLAPEDMLARDSGPELYLADPHTQSAEYLEARALEIESACLDVDGVAQAEGAGASWSWASRTYVSSAGFKGSKEGTSFSGSVSAIAARDGRMERDYDFHSQRWLSDLRDPAEIGRRAGERAVSRLGAKRLGSGQMPVIFDKRVSSQLLRALAGSISGAAIARGTSFLKDKMDTAIFGKDIQVYDDPHIRRGMGSRGFDGEGVRTHRLHIIEDGVLTSWLHNSASARQLGQRVTGHGARDIDAPPRISTSNFFMEPGEHSPDALAQQAGTGLWITEMFGPSLNSNTGDYSVGCAGFAIENGQKAYPVSEITVAGNLIDMFASLIPASDLERDKSVSAPSLLIEGLSVAGQ